MPVYILADINHIYLYMEFSHPTIAEISAKQDGKYSILEEDIGVCWF